MSANDTNLRADDGTRTRDPHLGKVMLYQLSHIRTTHHDHDRGGASLTLSEAPVHSPTRYAGCVGMPRRHTDRVDETVVWCDGRLVPARTPVVRATDLGLTSGLGVYESLAVLDGQAFALTRHLERLADSAEAVGVELAGDAVLRDAVEEVAQAGGWSYGRLRITATAGTEDAPGVLVVVGSPARAVERVRVVRVPWVRNERSAVVGAKVTSTADNQMAARAAHRAGADEAVLANGRDELCECTTSNVLLETDDALLTPPLTAGCLGGVTRALLLEWSTGWGVPVREQTMPYAVLDDVAAGRAGLAVSSTLRTVVPVVGLDGQPTRDAVLARRARELFEARRRDELDP